jgi:hypothetical protein
MFFDASVLKSLSPVGTVMVLLGSPLISIFTFPLETNLDLANITKATKKLTINVNAAMPKYRSIKSVFNIRVISLQKT